MVSGNACETYNHEITRYPRAMRGLWRERSEHKRPRRLIADARRSRADSCLCRSSSAFPLFHFASRVGWYSRDTALIKNDQQPE
jgi:hypothetical protein